MIDTSLLFGKTLHFSYTCPAFQDFHLTPNDRVGIHDVYQKQAVATSYKFVARNYWLWYPLQCSHSHTESPEKPPHAQQKAKFNSGEISDFSGTVVMTVLAVRVLGPPIFGFGSATRNTQPLV